MTLTKHLSDSAHSLGKLPFSRGDLSHPTISRCLPLKSINVVMTFVIARLIFADRSCSFWEEAIHEITQHERNTLETRVACADRVDPSQESFRCCWLATRLALSKLNLVEGPTSGVVL